MTLLTWSNDYLIGDETIDAEHKELFRIINNFHDKWQERKESEDREAIATVLNRLVRYAEEHFQHEELIMRGADFPLIAEHRSIHEGLFERIFQIHREYAEHDLRLEQHTLNFVRNWLISHIVTEDYRFRDHLAAKKKVE